jgi:hypothetical protein
LSSHARPQAFSGAQANIALEKVRKDLEKALIKISDAFTQQQGAVPIKAILDKAVDARRRRDPRRRRRGPRLIEQSGVECRRF